MTMVMNTYKPDDVLVLFEMSNFVNTKELLNLANSNQNFYVAPQSGTKKKKKKKKKKNNNNNVSA